MARSTKSDSRSAVGSHSVPSTTPEGSSSVAFTARCSLGPGASGAATDTRNVSPCVSAKNGIVPTFAITTLVIGYQGWCAR